MAPYVDATDICIFHNNAPGQHGTLALGGDEPADPVSVGAGDSAAGTAVAAGLAAGAVGALGGPVTALAAAAVGAYTGSLIGAMDGMPGEEGPPHAPDRRPGGVMLSVRIAKPELETRVIDLLRAEGAADIEQARGVWHDGDWTDFDPVAAPRLVDVAGD